MKKVLALALCLVMLVGGTTGCLNFSNSNASTTSTTANSNANGDSLYASDSLLSEDASSSISVTPGTNASEDANNLSQNKTKELKTSSSKNTTKSSSSKTSNKTTTKPSANKTTTKPKTNKTSYWDNSGPHKNQKIRSVLTPIGGSSLYYINNLTASEFFVKTGKEYSSNEKIMNRFSLSNYYNNKKPTSADIVKKSELVKVMSLFIADEDTISNYKKGNETYTNQHYITYAEEWGLIKQGSITSKNQASAATKAEVFDIIAATFTSIFNGTGYDELMKKYDGYAYWETFGMDNHDEYLIDCMNIINFSSYSKDFFSKDQVKKSYLNSIIIKMCRENANIHYRYQFERGDGRIATDISKMPKNYHLYPYILTNIPNYAYEYPLYCTVIEELLTPYDVFKLYPDMFAKADFAVENYLSVILNVDYNNITVDQFMADTYKLDLYGITESDAKSYVNYVKKNKIKITGHAEGCSPIVYYCDRNGGYLVRTHLVFNVVSGNTDKNLIFGDKRIKYSKKKYDIYLDVLVKYTIDSRNVRTVYNGFMEENINHSIGRNLGISVY